VVLGDKMKLALLSLEKTGGVPPLSIAYIASYLREYGGYNNIIVIDKEDPIKRIKKEKPDLVGMSVATNEFSEANLLAYKIKSNFDIPIIIGGHHISNLPHKLPNHIDIGVIGEGEETMLELIQFFEKYGMECSKMKKIDGLVFHDGENICITNSRKLIEPLDKIPYPARDLLKMKEYYLKLRRIPTLSQEITIGTHIITSRGCPYKCIFCSASYFWQNRIRFHSAEYVVGEIKHLIEKYKVESIGIYDDLFAVSKPRLKRIVELIKKEGIDEKINFGCQGRANLFDEETASLLKEMNVTSIGFGFESGSEKILKYLKDGQVTVEQNRRAIELCNKYGIKVGGFFILGSPGETIEDIKQTYEFIVNNKLTTMMAFILTPFPGTPLWEIAKNDNIVSDNMDFSKFSFFDFSLKTPFLNKNMTKEEFLNSDYVKRIMYLDSKLNYENVKIHWRGLFSLNLIKRAIKNPVETARYFKNILKF